LINGTARVDESARTQRSGKPEPGVAIVILAGFSHPSMPEAFDRAAFEASLISALGQTYEQCAVYVVAGPQALNDVRIAIHSVSERKPAPPGRTPRLIDLGPAARTTDHARDTALHAVEQGWVVFLRAGGTLDPEAVESWCAYATAHPDYKMIFSAWREPRGPGDSISENAPHKWTNDALEGPILPTLLRSPDAVPPTCLIDCQIARSIGGFYVESISNSGHGWEEEAYYYRVLLAGYQIGYVPRALMTLNYRVDQCLWRQDDRTRAQRTAVFAFAYQSNLPWMVAVQDLISEKRYYQLAEAFATIRQRNLDIEMLHKEIATARTYQEMLEANIQQARVYQEWQAELLAQAQQRAEAHDESAPVAPTEGIEGRSTAPPPPNAAPPTAKPPDPEPLTPSVEFAPEIELALEFPLPLPALAVPLQRPSIPDAPRTQQVSALIGHIQKLELELAAYRATTAPDAEGRLRELHAQLEQAQRERDEARAHRGLFQFSKH
jgi:hypothetical protein